MKNDLFCQHEHVHNNKYLLATYYIELPHNVDVCEKASAMAVGQTIGTWVPVPGVTDEMRKRHMGKVVAIQDFPPTELRMAETTDSRVSYTIQIAFPIVNFDDCLPMVLTTLLGNDASTSAQVKLIDLQFPEDYLGKFAGPRFGTGGIRKLAGVDDRPLILNMIKPCLGFTADEGAQIFKETALGGVDFIKDDELLGNPDYCKAEDRVTAYNQAALEAFEVTGHKTHYIVNATERADRLLDHARRLEDAGAEMLMINFADVGYSLFRALIDQVEVPVMGHYAGSGMFYEGAVSGMSSPIALGKLPRLCGADIVMINTPYGGYPLKRMKYLQTAQALSLPWCSILPALPAVGGGVHPGLVERLMADLGNDIILAPGGSIQGHPGGATAGARAMRQAVELVMKGESLRETGRDYAELRAAIERFGLVEAS